MKNRDEDASLTGSEMHVMVRLQRPAKEMYEHVRVEQDVGYGLEVVRSGVRRAWEFGHVFGPDVPHSVFNTHVVQRMYAAATARSTHAVLCFYGLANSGRRDAVLAHDAVLPALCRSYLTDHSAVDVKATLLRGEKSLTDLLPTEGPQSPHGVALTRKTASVLTALVGRAEEQGTVFVTFTVGKGTDACSKLSVVLFEAVDRLTPATRKHPAAVASLMRSFSDPKATHDAFRLAARNSKLTHLLHSSSPSAFAPGSAVLFVALSSLSINDGGEHVLRFASDLHITTRTAPPPPPATAAPTAAPPQKWQDTASVLSSERENLRCGSESGVSSCRVFDQERAKLETDIMECKRKLFESREHEKQSASRCGTLQDRLRESESDAAESAQREAAEAKEAAWQREAKLRLQVKVAELEQHCRNADVLLLRAQDDIATLTADKTTLENDVLAYQQQLDNIEHTIQEGVAATVEQTMATQPAEWRRPDREETELLRRHLEEAQGHIRMLAEATGADDGGAVRLLSRQLQIAQELGALHIEKALSYETRLESLLQGCCETAESEVVFQLETALERAERRARKAELEMQDLKLHSQAAEAQASTRTRTLTQKLEEAESRASECDVPEPDTSVVEEYLRDKSRLTSELQATKLEAQRLSAQEGTKEHEIDTLRAQLQGATDEVAALQQTITSLQGVESTAHLNVTKLAEASLSNARLKSDEKLLREENAALKAQLAQHRDDLEQCQEAEARLKHELQSASERAQAMRRITDMQEAKCREYEAKITSLSDTYVEKAQEVMDSLHTERERSAALTTEKDSLEAQLSLLRQEAKSDRMLGTSLEVQRDDLSAECEKLHASVTIALQSAEASDALARKSQQDASEIAADKARIEGELHAVREKLEAAENLTEVYKRSEEQRAGQELTDELGKVKEMERLRAENGKLDLVVQVKAALISKLEKQLARHANTSHLSGQ